MSHEKPPGSLVSYSDSDSEGEEEEREGEEEEREREEEEREKEEGEREGEEGKPPKKKACLDGSSAHPLPLPGAILEMFPEEGPGGDTEDNEKHEGRVRSFSHVRGNWATFVFIPFHLSSELETCVRSFLFHLNLHLRLDDDSSPLFHCIPLKEIHVSISRTVTIRHHWIEPLMAALGERMRERRSFTVGFSTLAFYCNEEETRSFLGLEVTHGCEQLCLMAQDVDTCFAQYKLQQFYKNPSFHLSLFWCLGNIVPKVTDEHKDQLQRRWGNILAEHQLQRMEGYEIDEVRCKTGNRVFSYHLS